MVSFHHHAARRSSVLPPPLLKPTRAEILNGLLKANIAPDDPLKYPDLYLGQNTTGNDILGTWSWLNLPDDVWHRVAPVYYAEGHRCVPCSLVVTGYQGITFDLTQDIPLCRARLERCYQSGLVPFVCVQLGPEGNGDETIRRLPALLAQIGDLIQAAFATWELKVNGEETAFTWQEHAEVIRILRADSPHRVIGVEFWTPHEDRHPVNYDGRESRDEVAYWKHGTGQHIDVLMAELSYLHSEQAEIAVDDIGGAVARFQGTWGSTNPNWSVDYGLNRTVMMFEYAAFLRWPNARKKALREAVQSAGIPLRGWGEG